MAGHAFIGYLKDSRGLCTWPIAVKAKSFAERLGRNHQRRDTSLSERTTIGRSVLLHLYAFIISRFSDLEGRMKVVDASAVGAPKWSSLFDRRLLAKYTDPLVLPFYPCGGYVYLAGHIPSVRCRFFRQLVADQPGSG